MRYTAIETQNYELIPESSANGNGSITTVEEPGSPSKRAGMSDRPLDGVNMHVEINDDIGDWCFVLPIQKRDKDGAFLDKTVLEDGTTVNWAEVIKDPRGQAELCFRRLPRKYPDHEGLENYEKNLEKFIIDHVQVDTPMTRLEYHEIITGMIVKLLTCSQFGAVLTVTRSVDQDEIFLAIKLHDAVLPMTAEFYNYNTEMKPITDELARDVYKASGAGFYSSPEMQPMDKVVTGDSSPI
jgi:hypothetical protein